MTEQELEAWNKSINDWLLLHAGEVEKGATVRSRTLVEGFMLAIREIRALREGLQWCDELFDNWGSQDLLCARDKQILHNLHALLGVSET